eukprot:9974222-Alexandrium_andersonii.AAC.1
MRCGCPHAWGRLLPPASPAAWGSAPRPLAAVGASPALRGAPLARAGVVAGPDGVPAPVHC